MMTKSSETPTSILLQRLAVLRQRIVDSSDTHEYGLLELEEKWLARSAPWRAQLSGAQSRVAALEQANAQLVARAAEHERVNADFTQLRQERDQLLQAHQHSTAALKESEELLEVFEAGYSELQQKLVATEAELAKHKGDPTMDVPLRKNPAAVRSVFATGSPRSREGSSTTKRMGSSGSWRI